MERAIYNYADEAGNTLFTKERYVKKDGSKGYAYSHVDTEGKAVKTMPTFAGGTPLYNLHRLAKYPNSVVYFVEGEKCVEALTRLKILATTSGGATSDDKAYFQPLAGRNVIVWSDNDTAGREHAERVAEKLKSLKASVREVDIDALNLPVKGDVVDWLQAFESEHGKPATKAEIEALPLKTDVVQEPITDYSYAGDTQTLPQTDDVVIARLATLKPLEYDRIRTVEAKALKVQVKTLDSLVKAEREKLKQDDSPFADIEPWHEAINPAQLLDELTSTILRFIVLDKHQAQTAALWVSACWFVDVIQCAPLALINAPERACGKSQLLTVMAKLAPRAAQASGISPSVLFRMIEAHKPTLFVDEIETVLKDNEDLRGLINAGHTRDSAFVWRSVAKGDDFEPKRFSVWGMKAIAGINAIKLAETVTSRSIVFELRRKTVSESVERLRRAEAGLFEALASKLARFRDDYIEAVQQARPDLPDALGDREQDNFEPLLQVAMVAGSHWLDTATNAALKLSGAMQAPMSSANELLADIKEIFEAKEVIKITTSELIAALCEDTEKSWATYNRGKPLSPRQLSTKLRDYGITSKDLRFGYDGVKKGYEANQFNDAFTRYLSPPPENGLLSATPLQTNNGAAFNVADVKTISATRNISATPEPNNHAVCSGVADKIAILGGTTHTHSNDDIARY